MLKVISPLAPAQDRIVTHVVDSAFTVHQALGPGFKEKIYQRAFCLELDARGLQFACEQPIDVVYKQWRIPGQRIDLIVERLVLVELKAVPRLRPIHRAQALSYLKTTGLRVALVINFNTELFKAGIRRVIV